MLGLRIHREYQAHPQAAVLTANRVSGREHEIAADEAILGVLLSAGFGAEAAARVYHVFIDQTLAFAALDAASLALPEARPATATVRDYVALTKPRLNFLVVATSAAGYYLGAARTIDAAAMAQAVAGTALASHSAPLTIGTITAHE